MEVRTRTEELIGTKQEVGTGGYVQLVDVMGSDMRIVNAARVSYGRHGRDELSGDEVKDKALIRYLMRHRHTSPFEQAELVFLVRCPMDVWRQWIRHRTASVNEWSTRYTEAISEMATTDPGAWRLQSQTNKQGSQSTVDPDEGEDLTQYEANLHEHAREVYRHRLSAGVAREQARKDLPLSTYTEAYWKMDLHNLLHFLELRMDSHAQLEIREYANVIWTFVEALFPWTAAAFRDYRLNAVTFTADEVEALAAWGAFNGYADSLLKLGNMGDREHRELITKVKRIQGDDA